MEASSEIFREEPRAVFSALLEEDETIVDVDAAGDRLTERFALVLVRNGKAEGLPKVASQLEVAVLEAAKSASATARSAEPISISRLSHRVDSMKRARHLDRSYFNQAT